MSNIIKVHVADDHKILVDGIEALLNTEESIELEGFSLTGKELIDWFEPGKADVIILDINMPEIDGIEVLKIFQNRSIDQKIIVLSGMSEPKLIQEVLALGASGFVEKSSASEHIVQAIKAVSQGEKYYSDEIRDKLFELYINDKKADNTIRNSIAEPLTDREIEVLKLITKELSSSEIAKKLSINLKTVESHRRSLYKKIKVKNVVGLIMYAVKNNIV